MTKFHAVLCVYNVMDWIWENLAPIHTKSNLDKDFWYHTVFYSNFSSVKVEGLTSGHGFVGMVCTEIECLRKLASCALLWFGVIWVYAESMKGPNWTLIFLLCWMSLGPKHPLKQWRSKNKSYSCWYMLPTDLWYMFAP